MQDVTLCLASVIIVSSDKIKLDLSHSITIYHLHEYVLLFEVLLHVFAYFF